MWRAEKYFAYALCFTLTTTWAACDFLCPEVKCPEVKDTATKPMPESGSKQAKVTTNESNLNIRKEPNTEAEIVGKAASGSVVTILDSTDNQWIRVKTAEGVEGYAWSQYLAKDSMQNLPR